MAERTIFLDAGRHASESRKIRVESYRWYVSIELDRDWYVDSTIGARRKEPELPVAYTEAVDRLRLAAIDLIRYSGYLGDFVFGNGPRWISLSVPFSHVAATVDALRDAELNSDYRQLNELADRLALPVEKWLAPGERELVRGVDFDAPPGTFLKFLRRKAAARGVRLNGRATAGSVWIRPTLPPFQRQLREMFPEQHPGWVDHWSGHIEPEGAPVRPWVGGRDEDLSRGSVPISFRQVGSIDDGGGACACGLSLRELDFEDRTHPAHHEAWDLGVRAPRSIEWAGRLAVVTTQSPISWRKLAYRVAKMPQRENHYDFRSWSHTGAPEVTADNTRAYLLKTNERVIGYLAANDGDRHRWWDLNDNSRGGATDTRLRPRIILIWVANAYRGRGVGSTLVAELASDFGVAIGDVSWSSPLSDAGRYLARRLSPAGVWIS